MSVKTKVVVELEIQTGSSWGDDCTVSQIKKQSFHEAKLILSKAIDNNKNIRYNSSPKLLNIIINED